MKELIVFDLDGTIAESKSSLDDEMSALLRDLLGIVRVAVISGGNWPQFEKQLVSNLPRDANLLNLSLLPTCGTKFYKYGATWEELYSEDFTHEEKAKIIGALHEAVGSLSFNAKMVWGKPIEDRGSQIKALLDKSIPEFSVRLGGTTSVDVTRHGIDKAYGIRKLRDILGIAISEMIFIGDALFPGGNDYPAKEAGVVSIQVRDPSETKRVIEAIIACLDSKPDQ
jgi:phosphomannomutase